jgi:hypothetical protein
MRNEEPICSDPPPGFTGDLVADVGASLGWLWAHPERRLEDPVEDRFEARRAQELATALSRESEFAEGFADARLPLLADLGHVELRRLSSRPC